MSVSHHARKLEESIGKVRQTTLDALARGLPKTKYWRFVGQIEAFDIAIRLSQQTDTDLTGEVHGGA